MPTGYTAGVTDTTTLAEFAMACATAFGALVTMREEPHDAPIPDAFEPSNYHLEALKRDTPRLAELRSMTTEQAAVMADADHAAAVSEWERHKSENDALRARYDRLLALVREWEPPTSEHGGLREFMIQKLTTSIEHDCYDIEKPRALPPAEWLAAKIESVAWSVDYHTREHQKEVERTRSRTEWVRQLRASLAEPRP